MGRSLDAVVVGGGPNGLAAAITLARAGRSVVVHEAADRVGGGASTAELTLPGFRHDTCSAVHPMGIASPFLSSLPLAEHGLRWAHPEIALAHPLDDGRAAVLLRSLDDTAARNGPDGQAWARLARPLLDRWDAVIDGSLRPLLPPRHPLAMARFGLVGLWPATRLARRRFPSDLGQGLLAGLAAHTCTPLEHVLTAGFGLVLGLAAHAVGWPVAVGGSQAISDALASYLVALGGEIQTGSPVRHIEELPPSKVVLFDVTPRQVMAQATDRVRARRMPRWRYGAGVVKVDYALAEPVPWTNADARRAGTLHLGGTVEEIARSEAASAAGRYPDRPYVLVSQPTVCDPTRAPAGRHVLWAYCHVPHGATDATVVDRIEHQIERFAPGFRDVVLARSTRLPADLEAANANLVGGDIAGGILDGWQLVARLGARPSPYRIGDGLYLCSSSAPPGPGVHGMCGHLAAEAALRRDLR